MLWKKKKKSLLALLPIDPNFVYFHRNYVTDKYTDRAIDQSSRNILLGVMNKAKVHVLKKPDNYYKEVDWGEVHPGWKKIIPPMIDPKPVINSPTPQQLTCKQCKETVKPNWKICPNCETPLSLTCPNCKEEIKENWKTCPDCQHPLQPKATRCSCGADVKPNWKKCPECNKNL